MKCRNCGAEITAGEKRCSNCGMYCAVDTDNEETQFAEPLDGEKNDPVQKGKKIKWLSRKNYIAVAVIGTIILFTLAGTTVKVMLFSRSDILRTSPQATPVPTVSAVTASTATPKSIATATPKPVATASVAPITAGKAVKPTVPPANKNESRIEFQNRFNDLSASENDKTAEQNYNDYDALLNDVYQYLKSIMAETDFSKTQYYEKRWIKERDKKADEAAVSERMAVLAKSTKEQCLGLIKVVPEYGNIYSEYAKDAGTWYIYDYDSSSRRSGTDKKAKLQLSLISEDDMLVDAESYAGSIPFDRITTLSVSADMSAVGSGTDSSGGKIICNLDLEEGGTGSLIYADDSGNKHKKEFVISRR